MQHLHEVKSDLDGSSERKEKGLLPEGRLLSFPPPKKCWSPSMHRQISDSSPQLS